MDIKKDPVALKNLFLQAVATKEWMTACIRKSREKDYENPFRQMVYENEKEMNKVIGTLDENSFINEEEEKLRQFRKKVNSLIKEVGSQKVKKEKNFEL